MPRSWKLKRTTQCVHCPWRKDVDPQEIPHGYSEAKHAALRGTIALPGELSGLSTGTLPVMACHESHEAHCLGWLMHQLGPGNNIVLRMRMLRCTNGHRVRLRGAQHASFEETLPYG